MHTHDPRTLIVFEQKQLTFLRKLYTSVPATPAVTEAIIVLRDGRLELELIFKNDVFYSCHKCHRTLKGKKRKNK